jgi:hypothetical protein
VECSSILRLPDQQKLVSIRNPISLALRRQLNRRSP